jgi:precorrin-8X/cobalt-precorrin-8 methylmutase
MVTRMLMRTITMVAITITARRSKPVPVASPLFDSYLMVDWSAANQPRRGRDSIWLCHLVRRDAALVAAAPENITTRQAAHRRLREILIADLIQRRSVLVGCDFPFGYARGLAERLGVPGPAWRAVWDEIAAHLEDGADNANNRFTVAARLNARISGSAFPFWGCPASKVALCLAMTHHRRHDSENLAERRIVDMRLRRLQPGWKLAGIGSAGSQALTGIPIVRRLRDHPLLAEQARIWPFETGLRPPTRANATGHIVFAEIYPSLVVAALRRGEVKDAAQVRTIARHFADLDGQGEIGEIFAGDPKLDAGERAIVEREEGWVLGIIGPVGNGRSAAILRATARPG